MAVKGVKDKYWEMKVGGPYDDMPGQDKSREIFKCTGCGAETVTATGWNGAPDKHQCRPGCSCKEGDWSYGRGNKASFRRNFDRVFPTAPGAGL